VADALQAVSGRVMVKDSFSLCGDEAIREVLRGIDRPQVIVCGIESHVCVQQTVLDLLSMDHGVWVCADAVGSRRELDHRTALERMGRAGANVTTVESAMFELCEHRTSAMFKPMLELIKQYDQALR
jgi:isochorismate hydrolase